jgi:hypothetical protein
MRDYTCSGTESANSARGWVFGVLLAAAIVITVACSGCNNIQGPESVANGAAGGGGPGITRVFPRSGAEAGGDTVTLIGEGFHGLTEVKFGNRRASYWTLISLRVHLEPEQYTSRLLSPRIMSIHIRGQATVSRTWRGSRRAHLRAHRVERRGELRLDSAIPCPGDSGAGGCEHITADCCPGLHGLGV